MNHFIKSMFTSTLTVVLIILSLSCVTSMDLNKIKLNKVLRQMVNQTAADMLNLPSNATTIRENIVDTFSCENRPYGYYADIDNDCQIYHVCLPPSTQGRSSQNRSYRWSFVCPKETIFNQEILVCTRPRESIECRDASYYYDVNIQFGDINKTERPMFSSGPIKAEMMNKTEDNQLKKEKSLRSNYVFKRKRNIVINNLSKGNRYLQK